MSRACNTEPSLPNQPPTIKLIQSYRELSELKPTMKEDVSDAAVWAPLSYFGVPELLTPPATCTGGPCLSCSPGNQSVWLMYLISL